MKAKYIIGGIIIAVFMVWGASAFIQTTVQYVDIEKAKEADHIVQVMGKVDFETKNYDVDQSRLEFTIYDAEAETMDGASTLNVVYYGVVPGNFDQASSVVLKGKPDGDEFVAEQMLVKCPSKYQGEGDEEYQDLEKHNEAVGEGEA